MIPFNRPYVGRDLAAIVEQVATSTHHSGDGPIARRCEELLSAHLGGATVVLTPSCTHALELAALVLGVGARDEVIVPSFTFTSTATAFALRGAHLRFADIDPHSLTIDPASLERCSNDRTKVIVPVHYAGVGCELERVMAIASELGAEVVEDNAHGLFGTHGSRPLGTFGRLGTLSFHETKNLSSGEGGALVVNDPELLDAVLIAREKGTNRHAFFEGVVDKYRWVDLGSSWLPSEFSAAVLLAGLLDIEDTQARRASIWRRYDEGLRGWAAESDVRLPYVPAEAHHPSHLFYLVLPSSSARVRFIDHMATHGVQVVFHYLPLHSAPAAAHFGEPDPCPVAEDVAARLVRLPLYQNLTDNEVEDVITAVIQFV